MSYYDEQQECAFMEICVAHREANKLSTEKVDEINCEDECPAESSCPLNC